MTSRAVFVTAQLCFIIQVAFIPSALGSDGQSYGSSSPIQEQMVLKRSIQSQGLLKLVPVPGVYNLTLKESTFGIAAKWSLEDPTIFPGLKYRVTTAGVGKIVSQNSYNISGLACRTSYFVKVSPVDAAGADYGVSANATIMTRGVPELVNFTFEEILNGVIVSWSLNDPQCFPGLKFRFIDTYGHGIVSINSCHVSGYICNKNSSFWLGVMDANHVPYGSGKTIFFIMKGVPEVYRLFLTPKNDVIEAKWYLKEKQCGPKGVRFRVTTAGVDKIVNETSLKISGLRTCSIIYNVNVSPVDANGTSYGISANSTVGSIEVPEVYRLFLTPKNDVIEAKWYLKGEQCGPEGVRFRVTTAGVDKIVNETSLKISGLRTCNISYNVNVSPVDANGISYGISANSTVRSIGVPQLFNLTLAAANGQITAKWSLKDPKCFPNVKFLVSSAGKTYLEPQNSCNISAVACNTNYFVNVSPVGFDLKTYGDSTNATILVNRVPEVGNLVLSSTIKQIRATWALKNAQCFPKSSFRITTAGVDKVLSKNVYDISGLACNTSYTVHVSAVTLNGVPYGVSANATIITKGVPEVTNLILQATNNEVSAKWEVKDPTCFPNLMFRVTFAGKSKIISKNEIVVVGLPCDTSYEVKVSPINGTGADYGLAKQATIFTLGVKVTLRAMVAESLIAKWAPAVTSCRTFSSYEVTVSLPDGSSKKKSLTPNMHFVFAGLKSSTAYRVQVQPLDANGRVIGRAVVAQATTLHKDTAAGRCPYPTLVIAVTTTAIICAGVEKPTPSTNLEANTVCYNKHPPTAQLNNIAIMYLVARGWATFGYLQEYLRMFDHTGKFLVNGYYKDGSWVWGFGANHDGTFPIDPALVSGLPNGGDGPTDFKMLYTDSANDYALRTAPDGYPFDGMICAFPVKK